MNCGAMKCDRVRNLLDRYVCEELSPEERLSLEVHLADCQACQQQLTGLHRLVTTLQSEPSPPVPEQFVARLMSRARLETQSSPYSPGIRQVFRSWWDELNPARLANAVAAVATGILLGLVLGQQTWRLPNGVEEQPKTYRVVDSLDYFSGYAGRSFAETYLSLTNAPSAQEF